MVVARVADPRASALRINAVLARSGGASQRIPLRVGTTLIAVEVNAFTKASHRMP